MPEVETERLVLRCMVADDAVALARLFAGDWEAIKHTGRMPYPPTERAMRRWIGNHDAPGGRGFLLRQKGDGAGIGAAGFGGGAEVELGYALGRPFWGRGFATEAVRGLIDYARCEGVRAITAYTFLDNPASARVLEKAGFDDLGVVERDYPRRGGLREVRHFQMTLRGGS